MLRRRTCLTCFWDCCLLPERSLALRFWNLQNLQLAAKLRFSVDCLEGSRESAASLLSRAAQVRRIATVGDIAALVSATKVTWCQGSCDNPLCICMYESSNLRSAPGAADALFLSSCCQLPEKLHCPIGPHDCHVINVQLPRDRVAGRLEPGPVDEKPPRCSACRLAGGSRQGQQPRSYERYSCRFWLCVDVRAWLAPEQPRKA